MERSKFAKFLDNVAVGILVFFLSYLTAKKYIKTKITCLIISILIMCLFIIAVHKIQNRKYAKLGLKKQEQKQIETLTYFLKSQSKIKQNLVIKQIFKNQYITYKNQFFILKNQIAVLNKFSKNQATEEDVFYIISNSDFLMKNGIEEVSILCSAYDKNINTTLLKNKNFNIVFVTPEILYSLAKNNKYDLPEIEKTQKTKKISEFRTIFAKNHAKYFFRVSILLYIFSMAIPFSRHYIYFATASLCISFILLIFGKNEKIVFKYRILDEEFNNKNNEK